MLRLNVAKDAVLKFIFRYHVFIAQEQMQSRA